MTPSPCKRDLFLKMHTEHGDYMSAMLKTYKGKAFRISRARLDEKFISPAIQGFKALGIIHIVDQNAAISSSVERDA